MPVSQLPAAGGPQTLFRSAFDRICLSSERGSACRCELSDPIRIYPAHSRQLSGPGCARVRRAHTPRSGPAHAVEPPADWAFEDSTGLAGHR
jgi:hypothetical protein